MASEYTFGNFKVSIGKKSQGDVADPRTAEHIVRANDMAHRWAYYEYDHREPLKAIKGQPNFNVIENWIGSIVDTGVSFLAGGDITFQADDNEEETPDEKYIRSVWEDDPAIGHNKSEFFYQLFQAGGVTGTPFVRLYPGGKFRELPMLRIIDSSIVNVITNPDDIRDVWAYHLLWNSGGTWKRDRIIRVGLTGDDIGEPSGAAIERDGWEIIREERATGSSGWVVNDECSERWPYDFAPIFHCQNLPRAGKVFGRWDVHLRMNDAINAVSSDIRKTLYHYAHPATVAEGFAAKQLSRSVGGIWEVPAGGKLYNIEMESELIPSREYRSDLTDTMHAISKTPRLDPAKVNVGALSGFALQILYGPLLARTEKKRATYGGMFAQINRALLIMNGNKTPPVMMTKWPAPLPSNTRERAEITQILSNSGAGVQAAAEVAGYSRTEAEKLGGDEVMPPL